jgi:hypothetical protein
MWDTGSFNRLSAYVNMVIAVLALIVGSFSWLARRLGTQIRYA